MPFLYIILIRIYFVQAYTTIPLQTFNKVIIKGLSFFQSNILNLALELQ
jgi:hypothetical protein